MLISRAGQAAHNGVSRNFNRPNTPRAGVARGLSNQATCAQAAQGTSVSCLQNSEEVGQSGPDAARRGILQGCLAVVAASWCPPEGRAITSNPLGFRKEVNRRRKKVPIEAYEEGPEGLKVYDVEVGGGAIADVGARVAVHYDVKWRGITFVTSRQGMGVTGGTPVGFNVGTKAGDPGSTLPGIDLGVRGMRVGGLRKLLVPPNLAYGDQGMGEIPPNATLEVDLELLSIKTGPLGYRTKLVEG